MQRNSNSNSNNNNKTLLQHPKPTTDTMANAAAKKAEAGEHFNIILARHVHNRIQN